MIRTGLMWSSILILIMVAMGYYGQITIPEGTQIAVHWGISGEADRFEDKAIAVWIIPAIAFGVTLLLAFVPLIEPRKNHLRESRGLFLRGWIGSMVVVTVAQGVIIGSASGMDLPVTKFVIAAVGLLLAFIGNILGKSQSNFFVGIRTPWTLSSDVSWDRTHRLAGRLWVMGGLAMMILAFVLPSHQVTVVIISVLVFISAVPVIASYFYWRGDKSAKTEEA